MIILDIQTFFCLIHYQHFRYFHCRRSKPQTSSEEETRTSFIYSLAFTTFILYIQIENLIKTDIIIRNIQYFLWLLNRNNKQPRITVSKNVIFTKRDAITQYLIFHKLITVVRSVVLLFVTKAFHILPS